MDARAVTLQPAIGFCLLLGEKMLRNLGRRFPAATTGAVGCSATTSAGSAISAVAVRYRTTRRFSSVKVKSSLQNPLGTIPLRAPSSRTHWERFQPTRSVSKPLRAVPTTSTSTTTSSTTSHRRSSPARTVVQLLAQRRYQEVLALLPGNASHWLHVVPVHQLEWVLLALGKVRSQPALVPFAMDAYRWWRDRMALPAGSSSGGGVGAVNAARTAGDEVEDRRDAVHRAILQCLLQNDPVTNWRQAWAIYRQAYPVVATSSSASSNFDGTVEEVEDLQRRRLATGNLLLSALSHLDLHDRPSAVVREPQASVSAPASELLQAMNELVQRHLGLPGVDLLQLLLQPDDKDKAAGSTSSSTSSSSSGSSSSPAPARRPPVMMIPDASTLDSLIRVCCRFGRPDRALALMRHSTATMDTACYASLIRGFTSSGGNLHQARVLYAQMNDQRIRPNQAIYESLIRACWSLRHQRSIGDGGGSGGGSGRDRRKSSSKTGRRSPPSLAWAMELYAEMQSAFIPASSSIHDIMIQVQRHHGHVHGDGGDGRNMGQTAQQATLVQWLERHGLTQSELERDPVAAMRTIHDDPKLAVACVHYYRQPQPQPHHPHSNHSNDSNHSNHSNQQQQQPQHDRTPLALAMAIAAHQQGHALDAETYRWLTDDAVSMFQINRFHRYWTAWKDHAGEQQRWLARCRRAAAHPTATVPIPTPATTTTTTPMATTPTATATSTSSSAGKQIAVAGRVDLERSLEKAVRASAHYRKLDLVRTLHEVWLEARDQWSREVSGGVRGVHGVHGVARPVVLVPSASLTGAFVRAYAELGSVEAARELLERADQWNHGGQHHLWTKKDREKLSDDLKHVRGGVPALSEPIQRLLAQMEEKTTVPSIHAPTRME